MIDYAGIKKDVTFYSKNTVSKSLWMFFLFSPLFYPWAKIVILEKLKRVVP